MHTSIMGHKIKKDLESEMSAELLETPIKKNNLQDDRKQKR